MSIRRKQHNSQNKAVVDGRLPPMQLMKFFFGIDEVVLTLALSSSSRRRLVFTTSKFNLQISQDSNPLMHKVAKMATLCIKGLISERSAPYAYCARVCVCVCVDDAAAVRIALIALGCIYGVVLCGACTFICVPRLFGTTRTVAEAPSRFIVRPRRATPRPPPRTRPATRYNPQYGSPYGRQQYPAVCKDILRTYFCRPA